MRSKNKDWKISDEVLNHLFNKGGITMDEDGVFEVVEEENEDLNNYCYFCDFNEVKPHQHHIIRKCDGGMNIPSNRLPLCANHHESIHRRVYVLGFNPKQGWYYLINRKSRKVIPPTERQKKFRRKMPLSSIKYSNNLKIKGDLNKKAVVIVKDFEKSKRRKQKRILKNEKKLRKGVQSEKCAK